MAADVDRLTAFLQEKSGDTLRSVVHYEQDGHEVVYAREESSNSTRRTNSTTLPNTSATSR